MKYCFRVWGGEFGGNEERDMGALGLINIVLGFGVGN